MKENLLKITERFWKTITINVKKNAPIKNFLNEDICIYLERHSMIMKRIEGCFGNMGYK